MLDFSALPSRLKAGLPDGLKDVVRQSKPYQTAKNRVHSHRLANQKKLDICASEMSLYLLQAGKEKHALRGATCLEIGSGWLVTHSLVMYLLGAERVYATDVESLLRPASASRAVRQSVKWSVLDSLSVFEDRPLVAERLERLWAIDQLSIDELAKLGIEYIAPVDLANEQLPTDEIDFIFSKSVLEHVPVDDVEPLIKNLSGMLSPDGFMFHLIHLVDHRDAARAPFEFMIYPPEEYPADRQTRWGNRIRSSRWQELFDAAPDLDARYLFEWTELGGEIPDRVDPSISHRDEADLRVSHLGVHVESAGRS